MDLIIEDEYYEKVGSFALKQGEKLELALKQYVSILKSVKKDGIIEGSTAKSLDEFINQICLQFDDYDSNPENLGIQVQRYCTNFITKIDKADKELY